MASPKTSTSKILITGASGQYGRLTVEGLLAKGIPASNLLLMSRDRSRLDQFAAKGCMVRQGSFDDHVDKLAEAFSGAEVMLFIATARAGMRLPQHQTAVDAAVKAGVQHIIYTSIVGAHLEKPTALVAQEHRATEMMLKSSGIAWTALRDSQYAEALSDVVAGPAIATGVVRCNAADGRIALISRNDCVAAAVAVLANPDGHRNKSYEITGPELLSWKDAADLIGTVSGTKVEYQNLSDEEQYAVFDSMGIPRHPIVDDLVVSGIPWNSSDMVSFGAATRLDEMSSISNDVELLTGVKPKSFREILIQKLQKSQ